MFKELSTVLETCSLSFSLKMKDGKITALIMANNPELDKLQLSPLKLVGTPEDLDKDFVSKILEPMKETVIVSNSLKEYSDTLKAKAEEFKAKSTKTTSATTSTKNISNKPETKVIEKPVAPKAGITLFDMDDATEAVKEPEKEKPELVSIPNLTEEEKEIFSEDVIEDEIEGEGTDEKDDVLDFGEPNEEDD